MIQEQQSLSISIKSRWGIIELYIEPNSDKDKLYIEKETWPGESPFHLLEGCSYRYELTGGSPGHIYQIEEKSEMVYWRKGQRHPNEGILKTGIYVGTLKLGIEDINTHEHICDAELEIRSLKTDYQTDYRTMLNEIAEYYTELVLQQGSPVSQHLEIDEKLDYKTLYQRFSFVRSIVESEAFAEAIHKVVANPVRKWTETTLQKNIVGVKRLTRDNVRQLASSKDRMPLPSTYAHLSNVLNSVPRNLIISYKKDTVDNQENQFVKFVLRSFLMFCAELRSKKNCTTPLITEIDRACDRLNSILDNQFFRQVSMPTHMNLNSPVLQRKEGYREVLQSWLIFDLAAKLAWRGGDDIYDAGKKNVATLYEYWLFFKLIELISKQFNLNPKDKEKLVKTDSDGINLDLVQGKMKMIHGKHETNTRILNIAFYYNRTFSNLSKEQDPIHKAGSWTKAMRPDYTLSMWPGNISEEEAEKEELITHVHFDAKYRLDKILLEDNTSSNSTEADSLQEEKKEQEMGIYKRADLLKMHAYKDAIRRTSGAYVLYPGDVNKEIRGFHEIIPGLGAFCIRPGHFKEDSIYLKNFLAEVKAHLLDRTSEREKLSYYQYDIYKEANKHMIMEELPESIGNNRDFLPDETTVLIGTVKDDEHQKWVEDKMLYNFRLGNGRNSFMLDKDSASAIYLLLFKVGQPDNIGFYKLSPNGPKILTRKELTSGKYKYPQYRNNDGSINFKKEQKESSRIYLVYELSKAESEFDKYRWIHSKISSFTGRMSAYKEVKKLSDLIRLHE